MNTSAYEYIFNGNLDNTVKALQVRDFIQNPEIFFNVYKSLKMNDITIEISIIQRSSSKKRGTGFPTHITFCDGMILDYYLSYLSNQPRDSCDISFNIIRNNGQNKVTYTNSHLSDFVIFKNPFNIMIIDKKLFKSNFKTLNEVI